MNKYLIFEYDGYDGGSLCGVLFAPTELIAGQLAEVLFSYGEYTVYNVDKLYTAFSHGSFYLADWWPEEDED